MTRDVVELARRTEEGSQGATVHVLEVSVPQDLEAFDGHFPGEQVLPAAALLDAVVLPAVERALGEPGDLRRAERLKFRRPVRPGDRLELRLEQWEGMVRFRVSRAGDVFGSGQLHFVP